MSVPANRDFDTLGWLTRAAAAFEQGEFETAANACRLILGQDPQNADALNILGGALDAMGDSEAAVECLRRAARARRKDADIPFNLGVILARRGEFAAAEQAFRAAIRAGNADPQVKMNLASTLAMQGKAAQSLPLLRDVAEKMPSSPDVWFNLANALRDTDRDQQAADAYARSLAIVPDNPLVRLNFAGVLERLERYSEAEDAYRVALVQDPPDPQVVYCNLAQLLLNQGRYREAEQTSRRALQLHPDMTDASIVLARALRRLWQYDESRALLEAVLARDPARSDAILPLANTIRDAGDPAQSLDYYDRAAQVSTNPAIARFNRGAAKLQMGDFASGWTDYQERHSRSGLTAHEPTLPWTEQQLPADLTGMCVYLHAEQGLGDELFFARFVPALRERGARIFYRCSAKIATLLARSELFDAVGPSLQTPSHAEYCYSICDLPWALDAGHTAQPCPAPIRIDPLPEHLAAVKQRLATLGPPPYIALTWRAGTPIEEQRGVKGAVLTKELDPRALGEAIASIEATWISVQRQPREGEIARLAAALGKTVHDLADINDAIERALAVMTLVDDYVGVSNTNMHLMASTGGCAKVIITHPPEWRWMVRGAVSPWFPRFSLYRQRSDGAWIEALTQLAADLKARR